MVPDTSGISLQEAVAMSRKHLQPWTSSCQDRAVASAASDDLGSIDSKEIFDRVTTLMIGGLPFNTTSDEFIEAVDSFGFAGSYDFVYMPSRSTKKNGRMRQGNVGYAFVNFKSASEAARFMSIFSGFTFPGDADPVSVKPANCQGYEANVKMHLFSKRHHNGFVFS
jgi:RNA recognition motif-containing protein